MFRIEDKVSKDTTHVVYGKTRRTLNVLHGMARGCWLVSMEWVSENCLLCFLCPSILLLTFIIFVIDLHSFTTQSPEGRLGFSDVSPLSGISGLSI